MFENGDIVNIFFELNDIIVIFEIIDLVYVGGEVMLF